MMFIALVLGLNPAFNISIEKLPRSHCRFHVTWFYKILYNTSNEGWAIQKRRGKISFWCFKKVRDLRSLERQTFEDSLCYKRNLNCLNCSRIRGSWFILSCTSSADALSADHNSQDIQRWILTLINPIYIIRAGFSEQAVQDMSRLVFICFIWWLRYTVLTCMEGFPVKGDWRSIVASPFIFCRPIFYGSWKLNDVTCRAPKSLLTHRSHEKFREADLWPRETSCQRKPHRYLNSYHLALYVHRSSGPLFKSSV